MSLDIEGTVGKSHPPRASNGGFGDAILDLPLAPIFARRMLLKKLWGGRQRADTVLVTDFSGAQPGSKWMLGLNALMNNLWRRIDALLAAEAGFKHSAMPYCRGLEATRKMTPNWRSGGPRITEVSRLAPF